MGRMRIKLDIPAGLFIVLYLISFVAGIVVINCLWTGQKLQEITSVYSLLGTYQSSKQSQGAYFAFLVRKKSIFIGSSLVAGLAGIGEVFAMLVILWLGFLAGGLASIFLLQSGIRGLFFCALGILVQILFYIPATIIFLVLISGTNRYRRRGRMNKKELQMQILICLLFLGCCFGGIVLETYVNPFLWLQSVM